MHESYMKDIKIHKLFRIVSKVCSNCSKCYNENDKMPDQKVPGMVDKKVSTKDNVQQVDVPPTRPSKLDIPLVKSTKKKKKKKKRTKDKCAQKKERKATQTLAIVLGNFRENPV